MDEREEIKSFCADIYKQKFSYQMGKTKDVTFSQKEAIKQATLEGIAHFPKIEAAEIWKAVYEIHVKLKSGIDNRETIKEVISADQSWKKSSGHAFEEIVKQLGTAALEDKGIEIVLQRDLNTLIKAREIDNEPRDISWLKEQIVASVFDLYAIVEQENRKYCFGCIQSKTSVRDRVTRDREPSLAAMQSFFWSTVIVLDGEYLKNPKFVAMVNGGTHEYPQNGWHGMYVFSDRYVSDRIYPINIEFSTFKNHAIQAANDWLTQRQWFNAGWKAKE